MSDRGGQSFFFVSLPELRRLVCVSLSLQEEGGEARSTQIKTCRELVLLYADVLASPALDSFTEITLVMAIPFYKKGIIQAYGQRNHLQLGCPQCVLPGKDFLSETTRLSAVSMELSTSENQLCMSVEASTVRLPLARLEDFDIAPMVLKNFFSHRDAVLQSVSLGTNKWCFVLPSMKRGQVISFSRQLPNDGPFRTYTDLKNHWDSLYGYRLPELAEEEEVYCSVYFKLVGERLFTYPLSCIRLQPVQRCTRLDLQGALGSFISDARGLLQSVCGFPVRMTSKPCCHTSGLTSTASEQVFGGKPTNLTSSCSSQLALTQLPASAFQLAKPSFCSQQPGGQSCVERQVGGGDREVSSSTTSGTSTYSLSSSNCDPGLIPAKPVPKLVPIFRNKSLPCHVDITQLQSQRQQEQRSGGTEEGGRVTLPAFGNKRPQRSSPSASSSSSSSFKLSQRPPSRIVPCFTRRSKSCRSHPPHPNPLHSRSPCSKPESSLSLHPKPSPDPKPTPETHPNPTSTPTDKLPQDKGGQQPTHQPPQPLTPSDIPNSQEGEPVQETVKRRRSAVQQVNVEAMARSNQLAKVNSATLLVWLKGRGVAIRANDRKDVLMLKVMSCLAEA
ncbi:uncharacterized protein C18orf63 [Lampris incognitus]|uniref:uncharacterized protein C18orf63 n=1 Tax=Lampris incognitus TaxID=2546036 RepID=UPI0024B4DF88|nr:uncharacterized protein C18orf63 [Lampris incognitus]